MKIFYQGCSGAYGHSASILASEHISENIEEIVGVESFKKVFEFIDRGYIGVLPFENSYAGSIHENFYHTVGGDYTILGEIFLEINHHLISPSKDISTVKKVYSHPQALMQTANFLHDFGFEPIVFGDTAGAAKHVAQQNNPEFASVSSSLAAEIYGLNILKSNIQDQTGNTTRFFVLVKNLSGKVQPQYIGKKANKVSIIFKTKDTPSALYKCLGAFATRFINLVKIESLPAKQNHFEYIFWIDFEKNIDEKNIQEALDELRFFSEDLKILGDY